MSKCPAVPVLAYHARNVAGASYHGNDHVALAYDLALFRSLGIQVVRATELVDALRADALGELPERSVVLTFDDGPIHDVQDTVDPTWGPQRGMRNILREAGASATSFVIASPQARAEISEASLGHAAGYADTWWYEAQSSGELDIGTHSWNHVHPAVREMASRPELVEAFDKVACEAEAQRQVVLAAQAVRAHTGHRAARLFAYPYGRCGSFLVDDFLPRQSEVVAAFTTEPRVVRAGDCLWTLPRYVCGHHWKSPGQLALILMEAACSRH